MKHIDCGELSPRKGEYLLFILQEGGTVHTSAMAERFMLDPSTISKSISGMAAAGLVEHVPYRGARLTKKGLEYAEFLQRRHRILELVLSHYGLTGEEACAAASKLEGNVPRDVVDRICASLGHPNMGICGPIKHDSACCPCVDTGGKPVE